MNTKPSTGTMSCASSNSPPRPSPIPGPHESGGRRGRAAPIGGALQRAGLDAHRFKSIWKGFTNGRLIAAVEADGFDVLLTNDKNMASQQNLEGRTVAVVALPSNRRATVM